MRLLLLFAVPLALIFPQQTALYDGARGTTPDRQGMAFITRPLVGALAAQAYADGATTLDTTPAQAEQAGYFGRQVPALDRAAGFSLVFRLQVLEEQHTSVDHNGDGLADRAGLSVIVLGDDLRGIELGFWADEVWAQDDGVGGGQLFTHAEGAALDTGRIRSYELRVEGDAYTLLADGDALLTGPLRDYTAFGGPINPYKTPNLVFLGDDSANGSARVRLVSAAVVVGGYGVALPLVGAP